MKGYNNERKRRLWLRYTVKKKQTIGRRDLLTERFFDGRNLLPRKIFEIKHDGLMTLRWNKERADKIFNLFTTLSD